MYTVLLDSSNKELYVGLGKDGKLIDEIRYEAWQRQSEYMIVELEKILKRNNVDKKEIANVAVGIGPGSYTGVRISLTIAKTISLALNVPIFPLSSLEMLSSINEPSICLINARSKRSYIGVYNGKDVIIADTIWTNEEVINYINEHFEYKVYGDTSYLKITANQSEIGAKMLDLIQFRESSKEPLFIKPVYLKD